MGQRYAADNPTCDKRFPLPMALSPGDEQTNRNLNLGTPEAQAELLMFGAEFGDDKLRQSMEDDLVSRLKESAETGRPLRVYTGYDPSSPDLHLGHSITLRKMRQFQDLGHQVIFVVGTFTAQVGDTSDKTGGRPRLDASKVNEAARTYAQQAAVLLDLDKTIVAYNGDWLGEVGVDQIIEFASQFTVQQFLARDNYRRRIDRGNPVGLHEFFYPLLQGYDAVHLQADVQLGATEQLFNIMAGRKLQEAHGQRGCVCITFPILVGTDGVDRMSKSKGNYVGLSDSPDTQFGKVMSISDETMLKWIPLVTRWDPKTIGQYVEDLHGGQLHPMTLKKAIASEIVAMCHGEQAAAAAKHAFEEVHQRGSTPDGLPEVVVAPGSTALDVLASLPEQSSRSAARRLIDGRGVRVNDDVVTSYDQELPVGAVLRVGPRRFYRLVEGVNTSP